MPARPWACKASARDGAGCGLRDEPPDAWSASPVVWEGAGRPRLLPDRSPSGATTTTARLKSGQQLLEQPGKGPLLLLGQVCHQLLLPAGVCADGLVQCLA